MFVSNAWSQLDLEFLISEIHRYLSEHVAFTLTTSDPSMSRWKETISNSHWHSISWQMGSNDAQK